MSLCTGDSERKPDVPPSVYVTPSSLAGLLPPPLAGLTPLLQFIDPIQVLDVDDYCTSDPPAIDFSGITLSAVLAGNRVGAGLVAAQAITQALNYYLWFVLCRCVSGTAVPAAPPDPGPIPSINPPSLFPEPACWQSTLHRNYTPGFTDLIQDYLNPTALMHYQVGQYRKVTLKITVNSDVASPQALRFGIGFFTYPGLSWISTAFSSYVAPGASETLVAAVPATAQFHEVLVNSAGSGGANSYDLAYELDCSGGSAGPGFNVPCPPDPYVRGLLDQLLRLVTLIQRQAVPFAYVYGSNHEGLTDDGTISTSGIIGLSVDITTLPDSYGVKFGSPDRLYDLGYISLGTDDGWITRRQLDHDGSLWLPTSAAAYTVIGYSLSPGVEIAIRELVREP